MKKIKFWLWKCFHMKQVRCKHFCGSCEYYEDCVMDTKVKTESR